MRPEKQSIAEEIKHCLDGAEYFILADYQGLKVAQVQALRAKLAEARATLMVLRNRQFAHVARDLSLAGFDGRMPGPTAMVYGQGDVVEVAKALQAFIKANQKPVIKAGALQGKKLSAAEVGELAELPSLEGMRGILVGTLAAPMTGLVGVMSQKLCSLVYVLNAAKEKKEAEG